MLPKLIFGDSIKVEKFGERLKKNERRSEMTNGWAIGESTADNIAELQLQFA